MAPSLPPKTDELELELDVDEDEDEIESGRGERGGEGGCGGSPRYISSSSAFSSSNVSVRVGIVK